MGFNSVFYFLILWDIFQERTSSLWSHLFWHTIVSKKYVIHFFLQVSFINTYTIAFIFNSWISSNNIYFSIICWLAISFSIIVIYITFSFIHWSPKVFPLNLNIIFFAVWLLNTCYLFPLLVCFLYKYIVNAHIFTQIFNFLCNLICRMSKILIFFLCRYKCSTSVPTIRDFKSYFLNYLT